MTRTCDNWISLDEKRIQCRLCPRNCILTEGQYGFCRVRQNVGGTMKLQVYEKCCGLSIDPIEKKPLYHFLPGSKILSFGTNGCNLDCQFCQNWRLSKSDINQIQLTEASIESITQTTRIKNCRSIAFTYNEPIIFSEFVQDVSLAAKNKDIKTVMVSAGYVSAEARPKLFQNIDAANIDLKSFSNDFYQKYCSGQLSPVLETLSYLKKETSVWLEITTLIINGLNDSDDEVARMTEWIVQELGTHVPLHFSAFHSAHEMRDYPATTVESLKRVRSIALSQGLKYVYLGNIIDEDSSTTYCKQCNYPLIKRRYFDTREVNLFNFNQCPDCKTICDGIF